MELIDKAGVVAEAKDLYNDIDKCIGDLVLARSINDQRGISDAHWKMETLLVNTQQVLSYIINTLEVKEVDEVKIGETQIYLEDDGGEQPYDGKQWLDLSCTEYEIPEALFKDGDNVEILIRKAQKGE